MKKTFLMLCVLSSLSVYSQIITPLDSLVFKVATKHDNQMKMKLEEFRSMRKFKWLTFLPTVGYDPLTNRPTIGFSLSSLSRYLTKNHELNQKQQSIFLESAAAVSSEMKLLERKYNSIQNQISTYQRFKTVASIKTKLYEIQKQKHENNEISLETFLNAQLDYEQFLRSEYKERREIEKEIEDLEVLTNSKILYKW